MTDRVSASTAELSKLSSAEIEQLILKDLRDLRARGYGELRVTVHEHRVAYVETTNRRRVA